LCEASDKIIQIGDSFAEFSGTSLATFCSGKSVENLGEGGTDTKDWDEDTIRDALKGKQYDQLQLAIGGNDYLNSQCKISKEKLRKNISGAIDRVVSVADPSKDIVLIGYCQPTSDFNECDTNTVEPLNEALALAVKNKKAVYIDTTGACGGGSKRYFVDSIHPNNRGYCTLYQNDMTQEAFGCDFQVKVDCSEVPADVPTENSSEDDDSEDDDDDVCYESSDKKTLADFSFPILRLVVCWFSRLSCFWDVSDC